MQNFQQQYSRKVITGSFDDLQHICTNKRVTLKCEKESFSRKGLLLSRKRARGIGSGLIHGYYLLL